MTQIFDKTTKSTLRFLCFYSYFQIDIRRMISIVLSYRIPSNKHTLIDSHSIFLMFSDEQSETPMECETSDEQNTSISPTKEILIVRVKSIRLKSHMDVFICLTNFLENKCSVEFIGSLSLSRYLSHHRSWRFWSQGKSQYPASLSQNQSRTMFIRTFHSNPSYRFFHCFSTCQSNRSRCRSNENDYFS